MLYRRGMDWTIVTGAVLGSGLTLGGVWLTARQRERADRRAAWLRQLQMALGELAEGTNPERRFAGLAILDSLTADKHAPSGYRALAARLLLHNQSPRTHDQSVSRLDEPNVAGDNEGSEGGAR